jgi:hypothetical protein
MSSWKDVQVRSGGKIYQFPRFRGTMFRAGTPYHPEDRVLEHLSLAVGHDHERKIVEGHAH